VTAALACDVGDARQVDEAVAQTVKTFGRIDLLVNNAPRVANRED
jgi:NAD(P)-dependent dehydrogenase (short-subunit alcohol dehydrogenase family)